MSVQASAVPAAAAERSSNFFWGFLVLPRAEREALAAVYAYCRHIDDIVDEGLPKDEAARQLGFWTEEVERLFSGAPTHPIAQALRPHLERFSLPKEGFLEMIRGCRMDLDGARYETFDDLESYMRGVASSVGLLTVAIFRPTHTDPVKLRGFATLFGYAFQLTNIMRDVGADLELGRFYIPAAELRALGCSEESIRGRRRSAGFERLMEELYRRAKGYYRDARGLVDPRDRKALLPAEVMAHIYEGLLDRIRAEGFPVLERKVRLSAWSKAALAARAWLYCHGF